MSEATRKLILTLWRQRLDTSEIAWRLGVHESEIANELASILDEVRR